MSQKKGFLSGLFSSKKTGGCCSTDTVEQVNGIGKCCKEDGCWQGTLNIKVLGSGCKNCTVLADNTQQALAKMGLQANVEKVTDLAQIAEYGVLLTPALVIDEKVVSTGKILRPSEIIKILETVR